MEPNTCIGVDLGGTSIRAGRVEGGVLAAHTSRPTPAREPENVVLEALCACIEAVWIPGVEAIGVGVPSVVDVDQGIVYAVENIPSWQEVHLKAHLEARFGVPVFVNNDANCFAVGEYHFGHGRGHRHLVGLVLGTGLGAGIIIDGHLHSGSNCGAGELGAIPWRDHTVEYYVSGTRFLRDHGVDGSVLHARALAGDPEALAIFEAFGRDLGQVLMTVLYAYDPEVVVLGGSVSKAFPFLEGGMRAALGAFAYPHALDRLVITVGQESQIAILGAAALCLDGLA